MEVRDRPLLTDIFSTVDEFIPEQGSVYVFGTSGEQRCAYSDEWEVRAKDVQFIRVVEQRMSDIEIDLGTLKEHVLLRSRDQLDRLWANIGHDKVYLDITGLGHHVWAPLLRSAVLAKKQVKAVYIEPSEYRFSSTPTEGEIFDLSERINGISPIPSFASLTDAGEDEICFVPLLGFEGTRFSYLLEQVQPPGGKIVPIIGVPGFRPEYPFHTYLGNRLPLTETQAWKSVRFAIANCPFSLLNVLEDVARDYPQDMLKIAPIGTKPHALGAVLFTLISPKPVELVYDHPIRKPSRTSGKARLLVYYISALSFPYNRE